MSKGLIVGFAFGVILLGIVGAGASRQSRGNQENKSIDRYRAEIADATPVKVGVLSREQLTDSKLFNGYSRNLPGEAISDLIASHRGRRTVLERNVYGRTWFASDEPDVPQEYFRRLAAECDAIVIGKALHKTSQITEDDSFLFTDYEVIVSDVFKDNVDAPIDKGSTISVTSAGGKIVSENVIIKAGGNGVALLPINGGELLLFLKSAPSDRGYQLANNGAFELNGVAARPLAGLFNFDPSFFEDETSFLVAIKQSVKQVKEQR